MQATFSSNGRWVAYISNESRKFEVYVRPFPGPGGRWQISTGGGFYPTWSRNGRELFYEARDQRLMVVTYAERAGSFTADAPRPGFAGHIPTRQGVRGFELHPDGSRFAVLQEGPEAGEGHLSPVYRVGRAEDFGLPPPPEALGETSHREWRLKVSVIYRVTDTDKLKEVLRKLFGS